MTIILYTRNEYDFRLIRGNRITLRYTSMEELAAENSGIITTADLHALDESFRRPENLLDHMVRNVEYRFGGGLSID